MGLLASDDGALAADRRLAKARRSAWGQVRAGDFDWVASTSWWPRLERLVVPLASDHFRALAAAADRMPLRELGGGSSWRTPTTRLGRDARGRLAALTITIWNGRLDYAPLLAALAAAPRGSLTSVQIRVPPRQGRFRLHRAAIEAAIRSTGTEPVLARRRDGRRVSE